MIRLIHVSDSRKNMSASNEQEARTMLAKCAGAYAVSSRVNADTGMIVWDDFPVHNPLTRPLDIPRLTPDILGSRFK